MAKGDNKGNKDNKKQPTPPKPKVKPLPSAYDPSVGPPSRYTPPKSRAAIEKAALAKAPPDIKKLYDRFIGVKQPPLKTDSKEYMKIAKWMRENFEAPVTREERAIGVAGGRFYDVNTGKFLGYSTDTQFQEYLPKRGSAEEEAMRISAQYSAPGNAPVQAPRYFEGEEIKPATWGDTTRVADLQRRLDAAHMYGATATYSQGVWNQQDVQAYAASLAAANAAGIDVDTWLDQTAKAPYVKPEDSANPISITLARPEDIRQVANATAREIYGGYLPQAAIDQMVDMFHQQQIQAQTVNQQNNVAGGTALGESSMDAFVEQQIRQKYPNEVAATSFGNTFDSLIGQLTNPVV